MLIFMLFLALYLDFQLLQLYPQFCHIHDFILYLILNISDIYSRFATLLSRKYHTSSDIADFGIHSSDQIGQGNTPLIFQLNWKPDLLSHVRNLLQAN